MADVTKRMLDLLAMLQTGRTYAGAELAARLEVAPRTVRRDVQRLREYGYPVRTRPGPSGSYQLGSGTALPPMIFDDDEAIATLVGLALAATSSRDGDPDSGGGSIASAADRAFGKIDQLLPKRLRPRAQAVRDSIEAQPTSGPTIDAGVLSTIGAACASRQHVTFQYRDELRRVEPYRQVWMNQRWYLLTWDRDRADWRTFRLDRIIAPTTGGSFTPREIPYGTGQAHLHQRITEARHNIVVLVAAPVDRVRDRLKLSHMEIEPTDSGCVVRAAVDSFDWLILQIALLDTDFEIVEPPEFRDRGRALADRLHRATVNSVEPGR